MLVNVNLTIGNGWCLSHCNEICQYPSGVHLYMWGFLVWFHRVSRFHQIHRSLLGFILFSEFQTFSYLSSITCPTFCFSFFLFFPFVGYHCFWVLQRHRFTAEPGSGVFFFKKKVQSWDGAGNGAIAWYWAAAPMLCCENSLTFIEGVSQVLAQMLCINIFH